MAERLISTFWVDVVNGQRELPAVEERTPGSWRAPFLVELAARKNISASAEAIGVPLTTVTSCLRKNQAFRQLVDKIRCGDDSAADQLAAALAGGGVRRPK